MVGRCDRNRFVCGTSHASARLTIQRATPDHASPRKSRRSGFVFAVACWMETPRAFLDLSTRLVKDLKGWSEEAATRHLLSPDDLKSLQDAADTVQRVT